MKIINLQGQKFGKLTALRDSGKRTLEHKYVIWVCLCACGNFTETSSSSLRSGGTRSCGCLRRENGFKRMFKHGEARTRLYRIWKSMKSRCCNLKAHNYKRYGKRGIQVCIEWKEDFLSFRNWALNNGYTNNLTIDRIDNDGNYEPSNCQWITQSENTKKGSKNLKEEKEKLLAMMIIILMRKKILGSLTG